MNKEYNDTDKKNILEFLMNRWLSITQYAAIEKVYVSRCLVAKQNNLPEPQKPEIMLPRACKQIDIIKEHIMNILPEAKFIDYSFEAQAPLDPKDFIEVYITDHYLCVEKVRELMNKMKIS